MARPGKRGGAWYRPTPGAKPNSIPLLHGGSGGFGGIVASPASAGHGRSSVETLERGLQFFGADFAHPEDVLPAALDQPACVNQQDTPNPLPGRPGEVFVQAPPRGQHMEIEGQHRRQPPGGVCPESAARYDAKEIRVHSLSLGHVPIVDTNPRRSAERKQEKLREAKPSAASATPIPRHGTMPNAPLWNG